MDLSGDVRGIERQPSLTEIKVAARFVDAARTSTLSVRAVAIYRLLQNSAFGPDEVERITMVYEGALRVLGLADRTDPITEIIAKKIIEVAQSGERDPLRIRARAIAELGIPPFKLDQDEHPL